MNKELWPTVREDTQTEREEKKGNEKGEKV